MEQDQIKVSFSVGTKLLISIVSLVVLVIIFLNLSTIILFREDKKAYTYQTQFTSALLAGKEFVTTAKHGIESLKNSFSVINYKTKIDENQINTLESIINNQNELIASIYYTYDTDDKSLTLHSKFLKPEVFKALGLSVNDYLSQKENFEKILNELNKQFYSFVNLSKLGGASILGIFYSDFKNIDGTKKIILSLGLISLEEFKKEVTGIRITIANRYGLKIFENDASDIYSNEDLRTSPLFEIALKSSVESGAKEYDWNGTRYLGSFVLPGLDLIVLAKDEWKQAMSATYVLIEKFILLGSMAIGAAVIFAILFSKTLTAPIERLYDATKEVAKGNFLLQLKDKGRDEISALSKSFNIMSSKISELIQESMDKVHLENEMKIASTVQQTLIPPIEYKNPLIHIRSFYQAASQCGGDWWGYFGVGKKLCVMISDATGHGLPCALITASARSCFSVMNKLAQEDPEFSFSPSAMLSFANRVIYDASMGQMNMTFFVGVVDFENKTMTYSSAGHNPPWLFSDNGDGKYSIKSLIAEGSRLGETQEIPMFEEKTVSIQKNDHLFIYTDGLTEGKNIEGSMYGKKRVRDILQAQLHTGPIQALDYLTQDFMVYNGNKPLDDDVTLAVIQILDPDAECEMNG